jgi:hypothetical protein
MISSEPEPVVEVPVIEEPEVPEQPLEPVVIEVEPVLIESP